MMADKEVNFEEYTQEEITEATQALKQMTPQQYLKLLAEIDALTMLVADNENGFTEAGASVFCHLKSEKSGARFSMTARANTPIQALDMLGHGVKYAKDRYGLVPTHGFGDSYTEVPKTEPVRQVPPLPVVTTPPASTSAPTIAPVATSAQTAPAISAAPAPQSAETSGLASGTNLLEKVIIMDGTANFYVAGFKWPFRDGRGPEAVNELFDKELGWTPNHFVGTAEYTQSDWQIRLYVDWAREPSKTDADKTYYNVKRVHK